VSGALAFPARRARRVRTIDGWPSVAAVIAIASGLAILAIVLGWRGSDLPAQIFRSDLVRRDGFVIWNSQWFGGHALLGYSVIAPWIGAFTGPLVLGAVSCVASAVLFERVVRRAFGRVAWLGAVWFAVGVGTNLIVGRTTYALGLAVGLGAVYLLQRRHVVPAVVCAFVCSLSSPLAGFFLAVLAAAWTIARRERRIETLAVIAAALAPIAALAALFPTSGAEPYELWALLWDLVVCAAILLALWRYPVARWGATLFALAAVGCFLVPSAVGGNVSRLGHDFAGPLLACALLPRRRVLLALVAAPLVIWQWIPAVDGIAFARTDPSTRAAYYQPVLGYLEAQHGPIGRVEIPSTYRHWEAAYVAPQVLLARGWERQLDIGYNPIFYSEPLTAASYRTWLKTNGVAFVALPDARLDDSSLAERALLLSGTPPYLQEVWHDAHWTVWRVQGFTGLVEGPATLQELEPDRVVLAVQAPGDLVLRVRATSHWDVHGGGCAASTPDGWTVLRNLPAGTVTLTQSLTGTPCPS